MNLEQFRIDHFRESEVIEVQCLWLQQKLKELDNIATLKRRLDGLQHQNDRLKAQLELKELAKPLRLDVSA